MQMRGSKAEQTVEGISIILSNISKGTAFLYQGVSHSLEHSDEQKAVPFEILYKIIDIPSTAGLINFAFSHLYTQ